MITNQDLDLIGHEVCLVIDHNVLPVLEEIAKDIQNMKHQLNILRKIKKQLQKHDLMNKQNLLIFPLLKELY